LKIDCQPNGAYAYFYTVSGEFIQKVFVSGGMVQWNGQNQFQTYVSSGIYFYVIQLDDKTVATGKFLVTRDY